MAMLDSIIKALFGKPAANTVLPPVVSVYHDVNLCYIKELGDSLDNAVVGADVTFEQETSNPVDKKSVSVKCNCSRIGYLYKGRLKTKIFNALEKPGVVFTGKIMGRQDDKITMDIEYREDITVYTTPRGKSYHVDPCCIANSEYNEIKLSIAIKSGYSPCTKCSKI